MNIETHSYLTRDGKYKARVQFTKPDGAQIRQYTGDHDTIERLFESVANMVGAIHHVYKQPYVE